MGKVVAQKDGDSSSMIGELVAVAYEEGFFVGEVVSEEDDCAMITFIKLKLQENIRTTNNKRSKAEKTDKKFIFYRNLTLEPILSGRLYKLVNGETVACKFEEYKQQYFL